MNSVLRFLIVSLLLSLVWGCGGGGSDIEVSPSQASSNGTPSRLGFVVQPARAAGQTLPIQVEVLDSEGRRVDNATNQITLVLQQSGTAQLFGTTSRDAVNGLCTFDNLSINLTGPNYVIQATSPGLTPAMSQSFDVTAGPPMKLGLNHNFNTSVATGQRFSNPIAVSIQDQFGNPVTTVSGSVTVRNLSSAGRLSGTTQVNLLQGIATFSDLTLDVPGDYRLQFDINGVSSIPGQTVAVESVYESRLFLVEGDSGATFQPDLIEVDPAGPTLVSGPHTVLRGSHNCTTYDSVSHRLIMLGAGMNVLDANTFQHVSGSPFLDSTPTNLGEGARFFSANTRLLQADFDPVNNRIYLADRLNGLWSVNAATLTLPFGNTVTFNGSVTGVAYDHERNRVYLSQADKLYILNGTNLRPIAESPVTLSLTPTDGLEFDHVNDRIYAASTTAFVALDTNTLQELAGSPFSRGGTSGNAFGVKIIYIPQLDYLCFANFASDTVSIFRGSNLTEVAGSPIAINGTSPLSLSYDERTNRLFVIHFNSGGVTAIDAATLMPLTNRPLLDEDPDGGAGSGQRYVSILSVP